MKGHVLKSFIYKIIKTCFWSVSHLYKMKNHAFEAFFMFTKWEKDVSKRFSSLQIKKATFWSVLMYIKWKNSFLKRFSSLQNEKACFEAFCLQTLKNMFLKRFTSLQNEKPRFWSVFHVYKMRKTRLRSVFHLYKMKNTILKHFSCQNEKKTLSRLKIFAIYLERARSGRHTFRSDAPKKKNVAFSEENVSNDS